MSSSSSRRKLPWARRLGFILAISAINGPAQRLPPRPQVPPPAAATLAVPSVRTLPNGLRVVVIVRHSAPLVSVNALVMSGAESDPPGEAGAAEMVAGLLDEGTAKRTALEIAQEIDQAGGSIDAGAGWDKTMVSARVLASQRNIAFDVLSDILVHPAFRPAEIERFRKQTVSALQVLWQDPSYVADAAIRRLTFGGTPYAHSADGTVESNSRIRRDDLVKFHDSYYRPDNTLLAILGDISAAEAFQLAGKYFGAWNAPPGAGVGSAPAALETAGAAQAAPQHLILVIDKPDAVETEIRVGYPGIPRASPDFASLTVANQILGGPAVNLLFQALRTERGLAYGASSELDCYRDAGAWIAKTSTRTAKTDKALEVMLADIGRLSRRSLSAEELSMARNYLTGHQALEFESINGVAARALELMLYGLPLDDWNNFPAVIGSLKPGEILSAVARCLEPGRNSIVLVGNSSQFADGLKKFGPAKIVPIDRLDLSSPTFQQQVAPASGP